ncbi:nitrogenase iron-molybdenum cofactor biosynthesis protein NifN [Acidocella sp.]|uniref:nitrogenase iron-molybdenum cofactor biosynthesis protein NifN n=1 Tax=Acidocella sp. TaxID=50710 RepID=UPI003D06C428
MAQVTQVKKACTVNPLKMSQPIGGALAFMGLHNTMPVLHGSQGCTSFGLVLFVRHFKEAIPLQTTAMSEVATVLGGYENVEQAILNIHKRTKPDLIGICSTGVTEIKGDDVVGFIKTFRQKHPEFADYPLVSVSTPDFSGAFQDGWEKTVAAIVKEMVSEERRAGDARRVNVLPGCHMTPGDIDELRQIFLDFGLEATFLPDLSGSLDGHIPEDFTPTTLGGVGMDEIRDMGRAGWTIAIGTQMRAAARALEEKTGVPFKLFERLCGLGPNDAFFAFLSDISGHEVPLKYRRQRSQLVDAMLDGHFHIGGRKLAMAAEPDLLYDFGSFLHEIGAKIVAAVTTTSSPVLEKMPVDEVLIGDLEDLETRASERGGDFLVSHAHGRQMAERMDLPFFRIGLPIFDRLGAGHLTTVGYKGGRDLIFAVSNMLIEHNEAHHEPTTESWRQPEEQEAV